MTIDMVQLVVAILGGGGIAGLALKLSEIIKAHRHGELESEATAIGRWQQLADQAREDAARMDAELRWYRLHYTRLWVAYNALPPADKEQFPTVPPPPAMTEQED